MQANTPTVNSSYDSDSIASQLESFVNTVTTALSQTNADSDVIDAVEEQGADLTDTVDNEISDLNNELQQLKNEQTETRRQQAEDRQRISNVEETVEEISDTVDADNEGGETVSTDHEPHPNDGETTSLEQICGLPEHIVDDNLTANQKRARSVARRISEYGKSVPAGIAITSSRIKRVLTAQEDSTIHRQTVKRVADFLKQFGDGEVKIKETQSGKTTVVFTEQLVDAVTSVVTEKEPTTVTPAVV